MQRRHLVNWRSMKPCSVTCQLVTSWQTPLYICDNSRLTNFNHVIIHLPCLENIWNVMELMQFSQSSRLFNISNRPNEQESCCPLGKGGFSRSNVQRFVSSCFNSGYSMYFTLKASVAKRANAVQWPNSLFPMRLPRVEVQLNLASSLVVSGVTCAFRGLCPVSCQPNAGIRRIWVINKLINEC